MTNGLVACPYLAAGRVGVETCYRCPRLRAFYDEESGTKVVCSRPLRLRRPRSQAWHARAPHPC